MCVFESSQPFTSSWDLIEKKTREKDWEIIEKEIQVKAYKQDRRKQKEKWKRND